MLSVSKCGPGCHIFGLTDRDLCNRVRIFASFSLFAEMPRITNQDLVENNKVNQPLPRKIHSLRKWVFQGLVLHINLAISGTDKVPRQTYFLMLYWLSTKFVKVTSSYQFPGRKTLFLKTV